MKKLFNVQYLACIIFILVLFSILPTEALATRSLSGNGNGNQYADGNIINTEYYEKDNSNVTNVTNGTDNSSSEDVKEENRIRTQDKDRYPVSLQERKQIQEDLQLKKSEYKEAKKDFLKVRNQIQAGKLNPNSEEAINATSIYLNSSISYMVAHLKNVKTNMQYSKGNGTEEIIIIIDENIKMLEDEQAKVENASSQQELIAVVKSVREIWTSVQKTSLTGAGQIVSQKLEEFLVKSENLSEELEIEIQNLNETDNDTADLKIRLASYNLYIKAAQEKKAAADSIYEDENAALEDLEVANNYLRESLNNVNKANQILRVIFGELKEYNFKETGKVGTENSTKIELNNTTSAN